MSASNDKKDIYSILNIDPNVKSTHTYPEALGPVMKDEEEWDPNLPSGSIFDDYSKYPPEPDNYWHKFRISTILGIAAVLGAAVWFGILPLIDFHGWGGHSKTSYNKEMEEPTEYVEEESTVSYHSTSKGLPIKGYAANTYPDYSIKTDRDWIEAAYPVINSYDGVRLTGAGYIGESDVSVDVILLENGQVAGRYRHENGTKLDFNGYVESSTGNLYVRLGHDYDSTESYWTLRPVSTSDGDGFYVYEGEWGKSHKPSKLTLSYR